MRTQFSARFMNFTKEEKDIYKLGIDLYNHHRHDKVQNPRIKAKLASYASGGKTLAEKNKIFHTALLKFALQKANISEGEFNSTQIAGNPMVKWATYAIISEMLDTLIPDVILDNFNQFAEIKNVGWGDQLRFEVPNTNQMVVTTQSRNNRKTHKQRLHSNDLIMTPENHAITVGEHWYRIVTGQVDWAVYVDRAVEAMATKISTMVYDAINDSFDGLDADFVASGAFDQDVFNRLRARVIAANGGGGTASAFGTQIALSKILPPTVGLQQGLGVDYVRTGYLDTYMGTNLFELQQRLIPGTNDFALDEGKVLILSSLNNKLVKIGFEGDTLTFDATPPQTSDLSQDHTIQRAFDVKLVTAGAYGVYDIEI